MYTLQESSMMLRSGIALSYGQHGDPHGLPLIMLHGYTDSWPSFSPMIRHLPRTIRAVAISMRGHGSSAKPIAGYSIDDFASDVRDAMDRLRIDRAIVLGHSMGSIVAQRFASRHPERVIGLVLLGAFKTLQGNAAVEDMWRDVVGMADRIDPEYARGFQLSTLARPVPAEFLSAVIAESLRVPPHVWRDALRAMLDDDGGQTLRRIRAPSRLIWGDQDAFTLRAEQDTLAAALPGATLVIHEGAGHALHWEDPASVAGDVTAWIETLTARAA